MEALWILLGAVILTVTLADTFLAVLNYNERGLIVNRVARWQWVALRSFTRGLPRHYRPFALRQVTGILITTVIVIWLSGVILGFAFIYYGALEMGFLQTQKGAPEGFWAALYMSIGQFSTVGVENVTMAHPVFDYITVLQALSSVVLLSMIITFLLNIYNGIQMLRSLCADVSLPGPGIDSPFAVLYPFFPHGVPTGLARYLSESWSDLNLYGDVLRQTRMTYYFQSGDEQFSAPFALSSMSGIIAALRWGMPVGTDSVSVDPNLLRLEESLAAARSWIDEEMLHLPVRALPVPIARDEFGAMLHRVYDPDDPGDVDPGVEEFARMCSALARLLSPSGDDASAAHDVDVDEAYARYTAWLPFAAYSHQFNAAISADLDYQPLYTGATPLPFTGQGVARTLAASPPAAPRSRWRDRLRRRAWLVDPGGLRIRSGLVAVATAAVATTLTVLIGGLAGFDAAPVTVIAAMTAVFAAAAVAPPSRTSTIARSLGALAASIAFAVVAVVAAALLPHDEHWWRAIALAIVAAGCVLLGRHGLRAAAFGQVAFTAFFLALLTGVRPEALAGAAIAAALGVLCAWCGELVPASATHVYRSGVRGLLQRTSSLVDAGIDAIGTGLADRRQRKLMRESLLSITTASTALAGSVDDQQDLRDLIQRLQTAAADFARCIVAAASATELTVSDRAILAARLSNARADLATTATAPAPRTEPLTSRVRVVLTALAALQDSAQALQSRASELVAGKEAKLSHVRSSVGIGMIDAVDAPRRSVQAGVATAGSLALGSLVSATHDFWAAMPAFQLVQGAGSMTPAGVTRRVVGTILGAAAGFCAAALVGYDATWSLVLLAVCLFAFGAIRGVGATGAVFWISAALALSYDSWSPSTPEWAGVRIIETVAGAAVTLLVTVVILPLHTRARRRASLEAAVTAISAVVEATFDRRVRGSDSADPTTLLPGMDAAVNAYITAAAPAQRDAGALMPGGIEAVLTAVRCLATDARTFAHDVAHSGGHDGAAGNWKAWRSATAIELAALSDVVAGRAPAHIVGSEAFDALEESAGSIDTTHVRRLDGSIIALICAVRPGSI